MHLIALSPAYVKELAKRKKPEHVHGSKRLQLRISSSPELQYREKRNACTSVTRMSCISSAKLTIPRVLFIYLLGPGLNTLEKKVAPIVKDVQGCLYILKVKEVLIIYIGNALC